MKNNKRVIVTMTSWKNRINNVGPVVFSILKNTVQPDKIICNLSVEEFPEKENEIPQELKILQKTTNFEINWVENNTYTFKKFIPTLKMFYPEDYYLFTIDDDELYKTTYIETGLNVLKKHTACVIAKRNRSYTGVWGGMFCCRSYIFKPDYWENITNELIEERMNDPYTNAYLDFYKIKVYNHLETLTIKYKDSFANRGCSKSYSNEKVNKVKNIVKNIFKEKFL